MDKNTTIQTLLEAIALFIEERDWNPYHDPKNLSMSIAIEAAELMELFQWIDNRSSFDCCSDQKTMEKVKDEIADVIIYSLSLCRVLNIDVSSSILKKIQKNKKRYPIGDNTFKK